MTGQPNILGNWEFDITAVEAREIGGIEPGIIVNAGKNFELQVTLKLTGVLAASGTAPWYDPAIPTDGAEIKHYAMNLETGAITILPYKIPGGQPSLIEGLAYQVTTGPYTTGAAMDLDLGTYQITTHIKHTAGVLAPREAAFFVSYLMVVVAL